MEFPRFILAGTVNTGVTYAIYLILLPFMPYFWAYSVTFIAGIAIGYGLNARWVFRRAPDLRTAAAYPLTYVLNYLFGVVLLWILVEIVGIGEKLAPLIVVGISVPAMYLLTKAVFGRGRNEKAID